MYKIVSQRFLSPAITEMKVLAPRVAESALPGQFVIVRVDEFSERIPLTICDYDPKGGTVTIVTQSIGRSTEKINALKEGDFFLDFAGPLGQPSDLVELTQRCGEAESAEQKESSASSAPHAPQRADITQSFGEAESAEQKESSASSAPHAPQRSNITQRCGEAESAEQKESSASSDPHAPQRADLTQSFGEAESAEQKESSASSAPQRSNITQRCGEAECAEQKESSAPHAPQRSNITQRCGEAEAAEQKESSASSAPHAPQRSNITQRCGEAESAEQKESSASSAPHAPQRSNTASSSEDLRLKTEDLKVLFVAGGVGTAPVYPQAKWLNEHGIRPDVIIGAKTADLFTYVDEMKQVANVYLCTDDGSAGFHGMVPALMEDLIVNQGKRYDRCVIIGPMIMMKFATLKAKEHNLPAVVSLNALMVDGTGMCGACRVTVGGQTRFTCVEGPEFDGWQVDFDEAIRRQSMYKNNPKSEPCTCLPK